MAGRCLGRRGLEAVTMRPGMTTRSARVTALLSAALVVAVFVLGAMPASAATETYTYDTAAHGYDAPAPTLVEVRALDAVASNYDDAVYVYDVPTNTYDAPRKLSQPDTLATDARWPLSEPGVTSGETCACVLDRGVAANTGTTAASSVADVLMPGGSALGKAGTNPAIRVVTGGLPEAQATFTQLSQGGTVVARTPSLTRVQLADGGFVQLRTVMSRSPNTAATIDVNIPGIDITKLKFNP